MKREIKFRVWDKENGCWVSIDSVALCDDGSIAYLLPEEDDMPPYLEDEVELMQYAGLKDVHGFNIYEGDIVKMHQVVLSLDDKIGFVEYTAQYGYSIRFASRRCRQSDWANDECAKYEVIGNIYENPELLDADIH